MHSINLFSYQKEILKRTKNYNKVAYYLDMGLGKTFVGSEKLKMLDNYTNLIICQKSKIADWIEHFRKYYNYHIFDLTKKANFRWFFLENGKKVGIINYDLIHRRTELNRLKDFTLMLDESSVIGNHRSKRTKAILKLNYSNLILLSGTPACKYERLYTQLKMLGYKESMNNYIESFCKYYVNKKQGFPLKIITGYKNINYLKNLMLKYGCIFLKTNEVIDLPKMITIDVNIDNITEYKKFKNDGIISFSDKKLIGDTSLKKMLYMRQICSIFNKNKLIALEDLINSTDDRLIIFYNFNDEFKLIKDICEKNNKSISVINGAEKDLSNYENVNNSVTLVQYQSGAMGLNLQKANIIIYFSPCLSSELYEQSKKRINRIGQVNTCFYYNLIVKNSIEEKIYNNLALMNDYTLKLFEKEQDGSRKDI